MTPDLLPFGPARALLDFLCLMKARGLRVTHLKTDEALLAAISLRDARLLEYNLDHGRASYAPTAEAFADWQARNERRPEQHAPADAAGAAEIPNEPRPPLPTKKSGEELFEKLEAWVAANPPASMKRLSLHLFGGRGAIYRLKETRPKEPTIERILDFLANPIPPDELPTFRTRARAEPKPPKEPRRRATRTNPHAGSPEIMIDDAVRVARMVQAGKRRTRAMARKALDAGVPPIKTPNAAVRGAMRELRENDEAQQRLECPIEQAKLKIRRKGIRCFDASVYDGEKKGKGFYYINSRRVPESELLAYAAVLKS